MAKVEVDSNAQRAVAALAQTTAVSAREVVKAQRDTVRKLEARRLAGVSCAALKASVKAGDPHKVTGVSASSMDILALVALAVTKVSDDTTLVWGSGGIASRIARAQQAKLTVPEIADMIHAASDWSELADSETGLPKPARKASEKSGSTDEDSLGDEVMSLALVEYYLTSLVESGKQLSDSDGEILGRLTTLVRKAKALVK